MGWGEDLSSPNADATILVDHCTFNDFGNSGRSYVLLDAGDNNVNFIFQNNIMANIPNVDESLSAGTALTRLNGSGVMITFTNNNIFNVTDGEDPPTNLELPAGASTILNIDPGWDENTAWDTPSNDFSLPTGSVLRSASTTGSYIGANRWAK